MKPLFSPPSASAGYIKDVRISKDGKIALVDGGGGFMLIMSFAYFVSFSMKVALFKID